MYIVPKAAFTMWPTLTSHVWSLSASVSAVTIPTTCLSTVSSCMLSRAGTHWWQSQKSSQLTTSKVDKVVAILSKVDCCRLVGLCRPCRVTTYMNSCVMIQSLVTSFQYSGRRWCNFGVICNNYSCSCCKEMSPTQSVMLGARLNVSHSMPSAVEGDCCSLVCLLSIDIHAGLIDKYTAAFCCPSTCIKFPFCEFCVIMSVMMQQNIK